MPNLSDQSTSSNTLAVLGAIFLPMVASVGAIVVAAGAGWLMQFCFTATFTELLFLLGLGKYQLWQVYVSLVAIAIGIRPIFGSLK